MLTLTVAKSYLEVGMVKVYSMNENSVRKSGLQILTEWYKVDMASNVLIIIFKKKLIVYALEILSLIKRCASKVSEDNRKVQTDDPTEKTDI